MPVKVKEFSVVNNIRPYENRRLENVNPAKFYSVHLRTICLLDFISQSFRVEVKGCLWQIRSLTRTLKMVVLTIFLLLHPLIKFCVELRLFNILKFGSIFYSDKTSFKIYLSVVLTHSQNFQVFLSRISQQFYDFLSFKTTIG